jgi:hypothetical protein
MSFIAHHSSLMVIIFALSACGQSNPLPSESDGKKVVEEYLKTSCMKLDLFKKVNATQMDVMGIKMYEMEYEASYSVASEPCYGKYDADRKSFSGGPTKQDLSFGRFKDTPQLPKGQTFASGKNKLTFVKKENGWEGKINIDVF